METYLQTSVTPRWRHVPTGLKASPILLSMTEPSLWPLVMTGFASPLLDFLQFISRSVDEAVNLTHRFILGVLDFLSDRKQMIKLGKDRTISPGFPQDSFSDDTPQEPSVVSTVNSFCSWEPSPPRTSSTEEQPAASHLLCSSRFTGTIWMSGPGPRAAPGTFWSLTPHALNVFFFCVFQSFCPSSDTCSASPVSVLFQVLCNGPGTCVPLCVAALLLGLFGMKKVVIVYVESVCRVQTLSLTGKILYWLADYFFVQWPSLRDKYPKSIYLGRIVWNFHVELKQLADVKWNDGGGLTTPGCIKPDFSVS